MLETSEQQVVLVLFGWHARVPRLDNRTLGSAAVDRRLDELVLLAPRRGPEQVDPGELVDRANWQRTALKLNSDVAGHDARKVERATSQPIVDLGRRAWHLERGPIQCKRDAHKSLERLGLALLDNRSRFVAHLVAPLLFKRLLGLGARHFDLEPIRREICELGAEPVHTACHFGARLLSIVLVRGPQAAKHHSGRKAERHIASKRLDRNARAIVLHGNGPEGGIKANLYQSHVWLGARLVQCILQDLVDALKRGGSYLNFARKDLDAESVALHLKHVRQAQLGLDGLGHAQVHAAAQLHVVDVRQVHVASGLGGRHVNDETRFNCWLDSFCQMMIARPMESVPGFLVELFLFIPSTLFGASTSQFFFKTR